MAIDLRSDIGSGWLWSVHGPICRRGLCALLSGYLETNDFKLALREFVAKLLFAFLSTS
jgi:hypothetical protein